MTLRVRATSRSLKRIQADLLRDLANMSDSSIREFQKKWSQLFDYSPKVLLRRRDELRLLWQIEAGVGIIGDLPNDATDDEWEHIPPMVLTVRTKRIRDRIWREFGRPADFVGVCNQWLRLERQTFQVIANKDDLARIFPNNRCLPAVLVVACVRFRDLMKVCGTCHVFFIATRRPAKFCSKECAKPAKREAKLRWWHRNKDRGRSPS
jgi:hypothetical protein